MATEPNSTSPDRTVLPPADPSFRGEIGVAFKDSRADFPQPVRAPKGAPNVLLIMGDDIGYGHIGAFGGPASTPVFDRLARQGLIFTNFHTTPVCAASRACLLTGRNAHSVGMGCVPEASAGFPGYNASIPRSAATVLEILRQNGYGTAWVGKTHLTPLHEVTTSGPFDRWPGGMGAEYFYGFFGPGVSQWHPPLWENTTPLEAPRTPEQGYHLEADMADQTIAWIERETSIQPGKPWIAYYAPNGHKPPVGVPGEWAEKYRGKFDDGKMVTSGGGCSTAAVISWPARIKDQGSLRRQFHHLIDVAPTILDSAGVPEPTRVSGIDQMPMDGVSMLYTFDDATARDRHTTQYFELTGSRAIYHDGWWAGTRHGLDGVFDAGKDFAPFDQDVWELYDMRNDFGHGTDLAARHPDKLKEMPALFEGEARKTNIYPMANNAFELLAAERPRLVSGNTASYGPGTVRLPEDAIIDIKNRSFSIVAEVDNPDGTAEGILVTLGGETGGFAFLVLDGKPMFHYSWLGREHYTIASPELLPKGTCTIRFDFAYDGGGPGKGGTGTVSVNGKKAAEGRIEKTVQVYFSTDDTFDVGEDWGTPVSPAYQPPFRFTGTLKKVTVQAR